MSEHVAINTPEGVDPTFYEAGLKLYKQTCAACHGQDGQGIPGAFPPLAGSEWVLADDPSLIIRMQLRGLMGPIEVKGQTYNGVMPPSVGQSDEALAQVFTYVRNAFGNKASAVTPEQIKAVRDEGGTGMLNAAELERPAPPAKNEKKAEDSSEKKDAGQNEEQDTQSPDNQTKSSTQEVSITQHDLPQFASGSAITWPLTSSIAFLGLSLAIAFLLKKK